ncbi:L-ascorbate oxidase, partial [Dufourea novaeangliae]
LNCSISEIVVTAPYASRFEHVDPETVDEFDWRNHACRRNCKDDDQPMECHYVFKLESYHTMSKACYDCPFNITDCFRTDCIPTDGIGRSILVVNRQMPGPSIEVCQGDRIIVDVINLLHSESTTMHWHGQHHVKTPYMDGVPYVSQCPILPGSSFRYDYVATEAGTHFWHSHLGFQRGDGVFGPLIVRTAPKQNWHNSLYDVDEHVVSIADWTHELGIDKFLSHHHAGGDNKPPNVLINGVGRFSSDRGGSNVSAVMPVATFVVKQLIKTFFVIFYFDKLQKGVNLICKKLNLVCKNCIVRIYNHDFVIRVNALNEGTETNNSISVPLLRAMDENDKSNSIEPDYQFYVSYDFYKKDNPHFHPSNYYGFNQVKEAMRVLTPQLNHISMKLPPVPLLSQRDTVDQTKFCNESTVQGCEQDYCACTHVLRVKLGSVVELVLVDEGFAYDANHPFHIHGYQFRVIAMERVGRNVTVESVKKLDKDGKIRRNLDHAPLKDTVTVPDGGYTIVRFHANNPGYWLFHCHIEFHAEVGMSLIFKVGEHEDMPPVPRDFPSCGDWRSKTPQNVESPNSVSSSATKNRTNETSNTAMDESSDNSVQQVVKLLAQILRTLQISSSTRTSLSSYFLLCFCIFVTVVSTFW